LLTKLWSPRREIEHWAPDDHRGGRSMLVIGGQAPAMEMLMT
jgi:hypothetical protein